MGQVVMFPDGSAPPPCPPLDVLEASKWAFKAYDTSLCAMEGDTLNVRQMDRMLAMVRARRRTPGHVATLLTWLPRIVENLDEGVAAMRSPAAQRAILADYATRCRAAIAVLAAA